MINGSRAFTGTIGGLITGIIGTTLLAQVSAQGFAGIESFLTNVGLPVIVSLGAFSIISGSADRESSRASELLETFKALGEKDHIRLRAAEERDKRRDELIGQELHPIAQQLSAAASSLAALKTATEDERDAIHEDISHVTQSLERQTRELAQWREADMTYRASVVTPALDWVRRIPSIAREVNLLRERVAQVEKQVSDTGELNAPTIKHEGD